MRLTNVCAMFLWCLFGVNAVPSGCGHCMEQEENGLVQLVNLQPNVQSSHYHPRRARRFRRFRRYGAKTTSTTSTTSTSSSSSGSRGSGGNQPSHAHTHERDSISQASPPDDAISNM
mmetsp:Transcript_22121/g.48603  ORF Transcript_22121/g.48603 Transcript_22121/m.48603 type:complete len:117 (+) Transcript_22121:63-413(+)